MKTICENELERNEQQMLLDAIWSDDPKAVIDSGFDVNGINIYRRNLLANAKRALSISFPTLFALLDSDISEDISQQFLKSSPPTQGDWAQWGEALPSFITTTQVGHEYLYLGDCTVLDWHVHCALHGVDQVLEQASLQLLGQCEPEHLYIEFNSNVKLLKTAYPIVDIFYAHHSDDKLQRKAYMNKAQAALTSSLKEQTVMIYRPEFQPKVTTLMAGEDVFMQCLMSGQSLATALDAVNGNRHFCFEKWLVKAIERNLIYCIKEN